MAYTFDSDEEHEIVASGAKRCALAKSNSMDDWYIGYSPRNGYGAICEGTWDDWVRLAQNILAENDKRNGIKKEQ